MPHVVPSQVVEIIDSFFGWAKDQKDGETQTISSDHSGQLAAVLRLVDLVPDHLIRLNGSEYAQLICCSETIRTHLTIWQANPTKALRKVPGLPDLNPVTQIRRLLARCPDEAPAPQAAALKFIKDRDYRDLLRTDISGAHTALTNSEWKAATVIAGSVVEALLLWKLSKRPHEAAIAARTLVSTKMLAKQPDSKLEKWKLHELIAVARELKIIKDDTAIAASLAKNFRNLIHPGKTVRLRLKCDRGTALSAAAAVEHVIRDLNP